jgi:glucosylceramidase
LALPRRDYEDGDFFWGNQIMNDLDSGASAWIYWNMILDERGGPWLVSKVHHDPYPNEQHPVIIVERSKEVTYTGLYYYLAHFSKFVRPGAVRLGVKSAIDGVRCVAFEDKKLGMVAEVLNSHKSPVRLELEWHGRSLRAELPALSIATFLWSAAA